MSRCPWSASRSHKAQNPAISHRPSSGRLTDRALSIVLFQPIGWPIARFKRFTDRLTDRTGCWVIATIRSGTFIACLVSRSHQSTLVLRIRSHSGDQQPHLVRPIASAGWPIALTTRNELSRSHGQPSTNLADRTSMTPLATPSWLTDRPNASHYSIGSDRTQEVRGVNS